MPHNPLGGNIYILKKDIQQQQGLQLCNNYNNILNYIQNDQGYIVLQEFLKDPYIINDQGINRKINLRIYLLITINNGKLKAFIYNDGFIYYTSNNYEYTLDPTKMITTGYINRSIYNRNPLTLQDLKIYLQSRNYNYNNFWNILKSKFIELLVPYSLIWPMYNLDNYHYQVFGVDVEPNSTFTDLKIIEVNKGPDLRAKDSRDKQIKEDMISDVYNIVFNKLFNSKFEEL